MFAEADSSVDSSFVFFARSFVCLISLSSSLYWSRSWSFMWALIEPLIKIDGFERRGATLPNDPRQFVDISFRNYMPIIWWQATKRLHPLLSSLFRTNNTEIVIITYSWNVQMWEFFRSLKFTSPFNVKCRAFPFWIYDIFFPFMLSTAFGLDRLWHVCSC